MHWKWNYLFGITPSWVPFKYLMWINKKASDEYERNSKKGIK
jgi:hypothetical protein